jgi:Uma2 family endonuclease
VPVPGVILLAKANLGVKIARMLKTAETFPTPLKGAPVWPLSVAAYRALGEAGLIPKETELLYGFVYRKMSKSPFHSYLVQLLHEWLLKVLHPGRMVRVEQPLACGDSQPEPDLAVVTGRNEDYRLEHPATAELVIEVCVSSHEYDRSKLRAYAVAGVKECWLVLAPEKRVEVYRQPAEGQFTNQQVYGVSDSLACASVEGFSCDLKALFAG